MSAEERIFELAAELVADDGYVSGERRFPRPVTGDEAADLALALGAEVDRGAAARGEVAASQGLPVVCARGCNGCCEELIMVHLPEAVLAARWLSQAENAGARAAFLAAYPGWREAVGDAPERLAALLGRGDRRGYLSAHVAQWRRRVLCAFNRDGDCTLYPVRPLTCRNAHAVETPALCSGANLAGPPASRLEFAPLDRYLIGAEQVLKAAHHALGGPRQRPMALCEAVYQLLQSTPPAE